MDQHDLLASGSSGAKSDAREDWNLPTWLRPRPGAAADSRDSANRSAPAEPLLSIGHNPTQTEIERVAKPKPPSRRVCRIWKGAARADFPGIPNLDPYAEHNRTNNPPRGKVLTFSRASRLNLSRQLATILVEQQAYTMALTLPGQFEHLSPAWVKLCFRRLCDQYTAKANRDGVFEKVGFYWKQELQKRGALHFHLLLYGIESGPDSPVRSWIIRTWNDLICCHPGTAPGDKEKHRWFHSRADNFQAVKDMHNYFAKYLGKAEMDMIAKDPIPGRWWGLCNRKVIPYASCSELQVPERFAIYCQRITRRIKKERINEAHHRLVMKKLCMMDSRGNPLISRFGMLKTRDQWIPRPVEASESYSPMECARLLAHAVNHAAANHRDFNGIPSPLKLGKVKLSKRSKFSGIVFLGKTSPQLAAIILRSQSERYLKETHKDPF